MKYLLIFIQLFIRLIEKNYENILYDLRKIRYLIIKLIENIRYFVRKTLDFFV